MSEACTCMSQWIGAMKVQLFREEQSVWDTHRGRAVPEEARVDMMDFEGLDILASSLTEARWRFGTRTSYNRWFRCWQSYAAATGCTVLPAEPLWLKRFLVMLTLNYAASTVQISACAISAIHKLNGLPSPITPELKTLLKSIEAVGICGSKSKKFIVDPAFVVAMCQAFLHDFPTFDKDIFDPWVRVRGDAGRSVMWLRNVAIILLGLEVGARASEVARLTACCWRPRDDGSVYVLIQLAKNGRNGEVSGAVLVQGEGQFEQNFTAISFFEEFWFPFLTSQGWGKSRKCVTEVFRTTVCPHCAPMFPVCKRGESSKRVPNPIGRGQVTEAVKKWASKIGREASNYSAISFRRGSISIAAAAKVDRNIRKKHGRWKTKHMQDGYTEVSTSESKEFGRALHAAIGKSKENSRKKVKFSEFQR